MKDSSEVAFNLQAECNRLNSELSALREENERLKSESFEELYNAVIDDRDAMREELASALSRHVSAEKTKSILFQRLTAAEQRNAELVELLRAIKRHDPDTQCMTYPMHRRIDAALKPTESGASE